MIELEFENKWKASIPADPKKPYVHFRAIDFVGVTPENWYVIIAEAGVILLVKKPEKGDEWMRCNPAFTFKAPQVPSAVLGAVAYNDSVLDLELEFAGNGRVPDAFVARVSYVLSESSETGTYDY
ncbi:MAG: hypothetical protein ACKOXB_08805 [Flavobacteriales bacterium]